MDSDLKYKQKRFLVKGTEKYDKICYRDKVLLLKRVLLDHEQIKEVPLFLRRLRRPWRSTTRRQRPSWGSSGAGMATWTPTSSSVSADGFNNTRGPALAAPIGLFWTTATPTGTQKAARNAWNPRHHQTLSKGALKVAKLNTRSTGSKSK